MDTYLSRENFKCFKGYLAICVFVHHLFQFTGLFWDTFIGYPMYLLGHFAVILFLFASGFGLGSSVLAKPDSYIKEFPKKRLLPYYVTYLFFVALYVIYEFKWGSGISGSLLFKSLFYGGTYISFGWYLQLTLVLYIVFYFIFRFFKKTGAKLFSLWIFVILFMGISFMIYPPESNYIYVFAFAIGISLAYLKDKITDVLLRHPYVAFILMTACFCITTVVRVLILFRLKEQIFASHVYGLIYLFAMIISDTFLIFMVITLLCVISRIISGLMVNPVSRFLGKYSLEMYAIQGLVLRVLNGVIKNPYAYIFGCGCVVIISAILLQKADSFITRRIKSV